MEQNVEQQLSFVSFRFTFSLPPAGQAPLRGRQDLIPGGTGVSPGHGQHSKGWDGNPGADPQPAGPAGCSIRKERGFHLGCRVSLQPGELLRPASGFELAPD